MKKEQEEAIKYLEESILIYKNAIPKMSKTIETVLNMLKEKDEEIEKLKQALARNIAKNITSNMKETAKAKEDLEMLNQGWQMELEKKNKQIDFMADFINKTGAGRRVFSCTFRKNDECNENGCRYCIKQYFKEIARKEK